jgi:hypothetical protein
MFRKFVRSFVDGAAYTILILISLLGLLVALSVDGHLPHAMFRVGSMTVFEIWPDVTGNRWTLEFGGLFTVTVIGGLLYGAGSVFWSRQGVRIRVKTALFGSDMRQ